MVAYAKIVTETVLTPAASTTKQSHFLQRLHGFIDDNMNVDDAVLRRIVEQFPGGCKDAKDAFLKRCGVQEEDTIFDLYLWSSTSASPHRMSCGVHAVVKNSLTDELGVEFVGNPLSGYIIGKSRGVIEGRKVYSYRVQVTDVDRYMKAAARKSRIVQTENGAVIASEAQAVGQVSGVPYKFYLTPSK